jgi:hypothetical protein
MTGRKRAAAVAVITAGLLAAWATPAFAPYTRAAANAINVTETCPLYLSVAVGRQSFDPTATQPVNVTILAFKAPAASGEPLGPQVLNRSVTVRPIEPDLELIPDEGPFQFHGRGVLFWNTGRLAPGTQLLVGTPDTFGPDAMAEPQLVTVSSTCDPPNLRLSSSCSAAAGQPHAWTVRNPEAVPVEFNAEVLGTRPAQVQVGTVPANGVAQFTTTPVPGPDVVVLFVGGIPVDVGVCLK